MKSFTIALKLFLFMTCLTGIAYPLLITLIAHYVMPDQAHGSLIQRNGQIIGSALIAQNMTADSFFWPRPSAIDFDPLKPSGGSNLGPTSLKLQKSAGDLQQKLGSSFTPELVYTSGSGLDPHISLEAAYVQLPRIAKARSLNDDDLRRVVDSLAEGRQFGFLGPRYVNVLLLNQALHDRGN